jgi:hypothetical protein
VVVGNTPGGGAPNRPPAPLDFLPAFAT